MQKVFVTGGTGLLGSHLLFHLLEQGFAVRALKRKSSDLSVVKRNFKSHPDLFEKIEWVEGDVLDINCLIDGMKNCDEVYHCAAIVSFVPGDKKIMNKVNIEGTANVVNACLELKIKKLCYVSSVAAIGRLEDGAIINEETIWKRSKLNTNYAISKFGAENEVWRGIAEGLNAVIVNPALIVGAGDWRTDSSAIFKKVYDGLPFYTSGSNAYIDASDLSKIMLMLMQSEINAERFLVVAENNSLKNYLNMIAVSLNKRKPFLNANALLSGLAWRAETLLYMVTRKHPLITKETASTAQHKYYYSNEKLKRAIKFEFTPLEQSIKNVSEKLLEELG